VPINLAQLRQIAEGKRNAPLVAGVRVSVTSAIRIGGMEAVDPKRFPLVEIRARADACPFCQAMNRKVFRKDAFNAYLPPFHINCRCVVVHLQEGVAQENFDPNEVEPLLRHAHFVADRVRGREVRYEALQIPARVEGRDFIFRRVKDPTTGQWVRKLTFRPPPERNMPGFFLEGLLPPPGERPVVSLQVIGRTLRQIPAEAWQEGVLNVNAVVIPPPYSPLGLDLIGEGWRRLEGDIIVLDPREVYERLSRLPDGDNGAQAFMSVLRTLFPELHRYMIKLPLSACVKLAEGVRQYKKALELIERVHKIPAIKVLNIEPDELEERVLGALEYRARYSFRISPLRIVMKTPSPMPLSTIIHEIGHLLDIEAFDFRGMRSSEIRRDLAEWWEAIRQSRMYRELMRLKESLRERDQPASRVIDEYYAAPRELFANSYAQYIATKTGDEELKRELQQLKTGTVIGLRGEYQVPVQWDEDDFQPIAEAFDKLFKRLGW